MAAILSITEKRCEEILSQALTFGASDIQIVPNHEQYEIYFKRFNERIFVQHLIADFAERIISYFKFQSSLDISEKRKPQSGAFHKTLYQQIFAFRISTLPSIFMRESLMIRILPQQQATTLQQLSYFPHMAKFLQQLTQYEQGLILFTGVTGSGKTTSLYSLIQYCATDLHQNVISLEDPVEYQQSSILQIQVNERAGVTYASGLRAILRHSPDVIMLGEVRDDETAHVAVDAALTGHLIFTTVHAKNTVGCLYRLMAMGVRFEDLRQSIVAVVAQQLVTIEGERTAIFEVLYGEELEQAFLAIQKREAYQIPYDQSLEAQRSLVNQEHQYDR